MSNNYYSHKLHGLTILELTIDKASLMQFGDSLSKLLGHSVVIRISNHMICDCCFETLLAEHCFFFWQAMSNKIGFNHLSVELLIVCILMQLFHRFNNFSMNVDY